MQEGWHADHVQPYASGGATDVINGQALCPECNLTKGASMFMGGAPAVAAHGGGVELRDWQERGVENALAGFTAGRKVFVAGVSVGAGKTIFGSALSRSMFDLRMIDRVIVVAPGATIKNGWADDMSKLYQLNIRKPYGNDGLSPLPPSEHGYATTYQSVDASPDVHRKLCGVRRTLVVLDEAHHIGVDGTGNATTWASSVLRAFDCAAYVLVLTGTPGRSDGLRIPFVSYSSDGQVTLDLAYSYGRAADDGIVRRCSFRPVSADGRVEMDGEVLSVSIGEKKSRARAAVEKSALNLDGKRDNGVYGCGAEEILDTAIKELDQIKRAHPRAAGLAVCDSKAHAEYIRDCLVVRGEKAVVVTSDDPRAHDLIEAFKESRTPWIVAIQMVAEGVNIPRLRVCAYLTRRSTTLALDQIMGRVVRVDWAKSADDRDGEPRVFDDCGMEYLPGEAVFVHLNKPELSEWTDSVEREIAAEARDPDDERKKKGPGGCLLPEFPDYTVLELRAQTLGETISGATFDKNVVDLFARFRDENPGLRLDRLAGNKLAAFVLNNTPASPASPATHQASQKSYAERCSDLLTKINRMVNRECKRRGWPYKDVHNWANRQAGIVSSKTASEEELTKKLAALSRYFREAPVGNAG